jgi:hypothetical protein
MFKNFFMRKLMKAKGASDEQVDLILKVVEKNPDLFKQIAGEIEAKVKGGMNQETAAMEVMVAHQAELKQLM